MFLEKGMPTSLACGHLKTLRIDKISLAILLTFSISPIHDTAFP